MRIICILIILIMVVLFVTCDNKPEHFNIHNKDNLIPISIGSGIVGTGLGALGYNLSRRYLSDPSSTVPDAPPLVVSPPLGAKFVHEVSPGKPEPILQVIPSPVLSKAKTALGSDLSINVGTPLEEIKSAGISTQSVNTPLIEEEKYPLFAVPNKPIRAKSVDLTSRLYQKPITPLSLPSPLTTSIDGKSVIFESRNRLYTVDDNLLLPKQLKMHPVQGSLADAHIVRTNVPLVHNEQILPINGQILKTESVTSQISDQLVKSGRATSKQIESIIRAMSKSGSLTPVGQGAADVLSALAKVAK